MSKTKAKTVYLCQSCGTKSSRWFGKCPGCGEWNTCVEELEMKPGPTEKSFWKLSNGIPVPITEVPSVSGGRQETGIVEFDRVLGGGLVPGSTVLVGGDPGIGKSTLLLQISGNVASGGNNVLYISGEESLTQTRIRAQRTGSLSHDLLVLAETNLETIVDHIEKIQPTITVVDSVQTMFLPVLESAPGSVSQVRECSARLIYQTKRTDGTLFLIGHVTKEGILAGPRLLEHMVDTVLYLEGEHHHAYRILRATKNRFGSINEIGIFEMHEEGMIEVPNPSQFFLAQRTQPGPGSVVVCGLGGTRPLLVEIQALVSPSSFSIPQRVTTGIDRQRLAILIAVLEKRVGLRLGTQDVFVSVAGGVTIDEPAVDLGTALAVTSSFLDKQVEPQTVAIGEVGLSGEIRAVTQIEKRISEASKLGFKRCIVSKGNMKGLKVPSDMEIVGVSKMEDALRESFII